MPTPRDTSTGASSPAVPTPATPDTPEVEVYNPLPPERLRRRHDRLRGRPLRDTFGTDWIIADVGLAPQFEGMRDAAFDMLALRGSGDPALYRVVAMCAITSNYDLTPEEAALVLDHVTPDELCGVAAEALLPTQGFLRTYTAWILGGLIANGIDPEKVPRHLLPAVLRHLEQTGRIEAQDSFINSASEAKKRTTMFGGL
jgi:hypothetical protein